MQNLYPNDNIKKITSNSIKHKLSHQQLHLDFYEIESNELKTDAFFVDKSSLDKYAFPIVLWNFIKEYFELKKN